MKFFIVGLVLLCLSGFAVSTPVDHPDKPFGTIGDADTKAGSTVINSSSGGSKHLLATSYSKAMVRDGNDTVVSESRSEARLDKKYGDQLKPVDGVKPIAPPNGLPTPDPAKQEGEVVKAAEGAPKEVPGPDSEKEIGKEAGAIEGEEKAPENVLKNEEGALGSW